MGYLTAAFFFASVAQVNQQNGFPACSMNAINGMILEYKSSLRVAGLLID